MDEYCEQSNVIQEIVENKIQNIQKKQKNIGIMEFKKMENLTKNIIYNFIKNNIEKYKKKNGKWNYKKIAQETQLDARTISKHLKDIKDL